MPNFETAALDEHLLIPRLLQGVHAADTRCELLGHALTSPILPLIEGGGAPPAGAFAIAAAEVLLADPSPFDPHRTLARLEPEKMGQLMPKVRKLAARGVPGLVVDLTVLAETPPFGSGAWMALAREEIAELRGAAGCPVWLYGVSGPSDAEIGAEAGIEGVVVHTGASRYLGGPAAIDVLPEVIDAVAGMVAIYAGGSVRNGIDVFRYLAVGAEAVVVSSDRHLENLEAELRYAMRLTGCTTLAEISYESIFVPLFGETP